MRLYFILLLIIFLLNISFCSSALASPDDSLQFEKLKSKSDQWLGENLDSSLHYAHQMWQLGKAHNQPHQIRDALIYMGLSYDFQNQFDSAKYYYRKAELYSRNQNDSLGIAKSLMNLGVVCFYQGMLDSAINYYEQSRPIFESLGEQKYLSYNLNNLAQIYKKAGNHHKAIEVYLQSLDIKQQQQDTIAINNAYLNLASAYIATKNYPKALDYALKALNLATKRDNKKDMASALVNAGIVYKAQQKYELALQSFLKSETLIDKKTNGDLLIDLYLNLAELYRDKQDILQAIKYLEQMKYLLKDDMFMEKKMVYYQLGHELYKLSGDKSNALQYLEKYITVKEKYLSQSVQETINDLERKYETELKERKITTLELDNKKTEIALISSNNQRNIIFFMTVLLCLFILLGWLRYSNKKKTSLLLVEKNKQISEALQDREMLLKEIHHRVKNNLQVISSLLNLQAESLQDKSAIDAVREGQNRVKSMSLIHQKLYATDDVRGVDVADYLNSLIIELLAAFGLDSEQISYKLDADHLKMDIDTLIPLGLIINELITNSLKYAFDKNATNKQLSVSMKQQGDKLIVRISDNGIGIPEGADLKHSTSFGWKMIRSLSRKLKAEINIINNNGTTVQLSIARYKLHETHEIIT